MNDTPKRAARIALQGSDTIYALDGGIPEVDLADTELLVGADCPAVADRSRTQFLIPVWNDLLSLILCLPTVLEVAEHVVIYDDGSDDGSSEFVEELRATSAGAGIVHISGRRQQGWTQSRKVLAERSDPAMTRVWADSDDLIISELWPRFTDRLNAAGCLPLGLYEVWGDLSHTTHWAGRGDPCHVAFAPGDNRLERWDRKDGCTIPVYREPGEPTAVGPLCAFHLNGFKVDERLAYKGRRLQRFNTPEHSGELERLAPEEARAAADRILFRNRFHRPAPMPSALRAYLESKVPEELRFVVTDGGREGSDEVAAALRELRDGGFPNVRR